MERRSPPPGDARDREEFERYCMTHGFRTLHHPESLVDQLVTQRAQALLAAPSVGRDIATGLLLPPPLSGQPVSSATKLVKRWTQPQPSLQPQPRPSPQPQS